MQPTNYKDNHKNYPFQQWEELRIEWLQLGTSFSSRYRTTNGVFFHKIVNRIDTSLSLYVIIICQKTRISNFSNRKYIWRRQIKHQSYYWTLPRMNISYVINSAIQKPMHIVSNHSTSLLPLLTHMRFPIELHHLVDELLPNITFQIARWILHHSPSTPKSWDQKKYENP